MIVAILFGLAVYRLKAPLLLATIVALGVFAGLIYFGEKMPVLSYQWLCRPETRAAISAAKDAAAESGGPRFARPYGAKSAMDYFRAIGRQDIVEELGAIEEPETVLGIANYAWIGVLLSYAFWLPSYLYDCYSYQETISTVFNSISHWSHCLWGLSWQRSSAANMPTLMLLLFEPKSPIPRP